MVLESHADHMPGSMPPSIARSLMMRDTKEKKDERKQREEHSDWRICNERRTAGSKAHERGEEKEGEF